jgi:hypothetical protein
MRYGSGVFVLRRRGTAFNETIPQPQAKGVTRVCYGILGETDKGWRIAAFAPLCHRIGLHVENAGYDLGVEIPRKFTVPGKALVNLRASVALADPVRLAFVPKFDELLDFFR